jgi:predicted SAM-dependent methyltransferase
VKLHLGCGDKIIPGFVNVDIRPLEGVDLVSDIGTLPEIEDNTVDLIYISHVLEHLDRYTVLKAMKRWHILLRQGGTLRIAVPDFSQIAKLYVEGVDLQHFIGLLYGGQNYQYNFHHYIWDYKNMETDLQQAGFKDIHRYDWRETEHHNIDDYSQSYYPHMDKENGVLLSLNVEAKK